MSGYIDFSGDPPEGARERHHDEIVVPKPVIYMTIALIAFTIAAIAVGRMLDWGVTHEGQLTATRSVSFRFDAPPIGEKPVAIVATRADGSRVTLARENEEIFPRLILRSVANIRKRDGVDPATPVRLVETADDQLMIVDPATHRTMRLAAFGPDNQALFDPLFEEKAS